MSETGDIQATLGRLLVIADADRAPGNPCEVFEQMLRVDPAESSRAAALNFRPNCIRADASGAELATRIGAELNVPVILDADADSLGAANCVIARSEHIAAQAIRSGADPSRVVTLHESVDRELFNPEGATPAEPHTRPRLLSFAHNNLDTAVRACELARKQHTGLSVVHIGPGEIPSSLGRALTDVPQAELPAWFRWADALLMPSRGDPGPCAAQALACGTPCILGRGRGASEFVADRWDGLLVDPDDVHAIAQAIDSIADHGTQARLAAPARTASERFDAKTVDQREAGVYRWLLREDHPLVSVVLPTYKRARLIEAAVRNVLAQDYSNLELIVVNDGSPDETPQILERLNTELNDPRLKVITQENCGLPHALNAGFAHAQGKYWTWTSDDNAYKPGAISALARELELEPDLGLVYAEFVAVNPSGDDRVPRQGPPEELTEGCCVGACFMYRATVARAVGEYDPDLALVEDYDYWLRIRKQASMKWLRRRLYEFGDTPDSLTRTRVLDIQQARMKLIQREFGTSAEWPLLKFNRLWRDASENKNSGHTLAAISSAMAAIALRPSASAGWRALGRALTPGPLLRMTRRMRGLHED